MVLKWTTKKQTFNIYLFCCYFLKGEFNIHIGFNFNSLVKKGQV